MVMRQLIGSRKGIFIVSCLVLMGFIGCISIPLGDPEKAKVDDKLLGAWLSKPGDGEKKQTLFTVVQYDARTCAVSEFEFSKDGDTIKPSGRFDWKMWMVDIKGTQFASMEMKNPQLALEPQSDVYASAKIVHDGDNLTITPVKDDLVKSANITTSQQLEDLIAANLNSPDLFGDPLMVTKVKDDQKEMIGKVLDAFNGGGGMK
jgi:hypothetical protein